MSFKLLRGEENRLTLQPTNFLRFRQPSFEDINNVEFCYQFDDEEPMVFGNGPNDLHIHVSPTPNGNIVFNNNGKTFKIFARERQ